MCQTCRILILTYHYPPHWRAASVRVYYFVKALIKKGFEVDVIIPSGHMVKEKSIRGRLGETIIYIRNLTSLRFLDIPLALLNGLYIITKLRKMNIWKRYDVILVSIPPHIGAFLGFFMWLVGMASKFVIDIRGGIRYSKTTHRLDKVVAKINMLFLYNVMKKASALITVTDAYKHYFQSILARDIHLISNGADFEVFSKAYRIRTEGTSKVAVLLADLTYEYNNVETIIKTWSQLIKSGIDIKLLTIGEGKFRGYYKDVCNELGLNKYINWIGEVPYEDLPKIMSHVDFGVVGRIMEKEWTLAVPTKVYEYMAAGLPVFAFGPPRSKLQFFIEGFDVGMYVPSMDPEVLAGRIIEFVRDIDKYDRDHILRVARFFDRRKWAGKFADIVEGICRER